MELRRSRFQSETRVIGAGTEMRNGDWIGEGWRPAVDSRKKRKGGRETGVTKGGGKEAGKRVEAKEWARRAPPSFRRGGREM